MWLYRLKLYPLFLEKHEDYRIVILDLLTYAGNLENLADIDTQENYTFLKGDICDEDFINTLFDTHQCNLLLYLTQQHKE